MGLYLCKRIVELHGGEIFPSISKNLWWARFSIVI
jgi:signal transduction histidine kinase